MQVKVYWNVHKNVYSVQSKKTRTVILHANNLVLTDAFFQVSEKGRQRVLREKRKNVHAFITGELVHRPADDIRVTQEAYYNPYVVDSFVDRQSGQKLTGADVVVLSRDEENIERAIINYAGGR